MQGIGRTRHPPKAGSRGSRATRRRRIRRRRRRLTRCSGGQQGRAHARIRARRRCRCHARALGVVAPAPKPAEVPGLRHANVAVSAPLSASVLPAPTFGRVGLVAFWDDDASLDRFLDRASVAGDARRRMARAARAAARGRGWPGTRRRHPERAGRRTTTVRPRCSRWAGSGSARRRGSSAHEREGRGTRARGAGADLGDRPSPGRRSSRPARCGSRRARSSTYAYGHGDPAPRRRDRTSDAREAFHHQSGVHPVPARTRSRATSTGRTRWPRLG